MYELTTDFMNLSHIEAGLTGFGGNSLIHVQNELSHILIQFTTCIPNAIPLHYCYTIHIIHNYERTSFYLSHCCTQPHDYRKELGVIISLDMRRQLFQYFSLQKKMLYLGSKPPALFNDQQKECLIFGYYCKQLVVSASKIQQ